MGNYNAGIVTQEKLINSAKKLFYEYGYDKTTIKAICEDAEILRTGFVYYFKDKAALADHISNDVNTQLFHEIETKLDQHSRQIDDLLLFVYGSSLFFLSIMSDPHLNLFYSEVLSKNSEMLLGDAFYRKFFKSMYHSRGKNTDSKEFELFFIFNTAAPGAFLKRYLKGLINSTKEEIIEYLNRQVMRGLSIETAEQDKILAKAEKLRNEITVDLKTLFLTPYENPAIDNRDI